MEHNSSLQSPAISIIVPVYKVEPYLRQCIDSILAQTFPDFELILVDDGSPDNCGAICDEYAAKDNRITVIHQENGGLSAARNTGIDWVFANSDSRWITFVDSDDVLAPIMLETLYKGAIENRADMVTIYSHYFSDETQLDDAGKYIGETTCATGKQLLESLYTGKDTVSIVSCGKLFQRKLFQNLRFPVGKIHEDEATTPILLFHAENVAVIRSWLYFYRQREGSIMHTDFSPKRFDSVDAWSACVSYFASQGDGTLARLARMHYNPIWARLVWTARQEGVYDQVPEQYRMGILRVFGIILINSLRRGGVQFVLQRIRNLLNQLKNK
jgi:glycosyltransferase involved in cell wall biosynthesis